MGRARLTSLSLAVVALVGVSPPSSAAPDARGVPDPVVITNDGDTDRQFANIVAVDGDTMLVSSQCDSPTAADCPDSAYVYVRTDDGWGEQAELVPPENARRAQVDVETLAISGDTAVMGVKSFSPHGEEDTALLHVYVRSGSTWTRQATLLTPDGPAENGTWEPQAVTIDGDTIAAAVDVRGVGVLVYVFARSGTRWSVQATIPAPADPPGEFGHAVDLDGDTLLVSAPWQDTSLGEAAGAVHVYVRSVTTWVHAAELTAPDSLPESRFGSSLALDGDTAAIGEYSYQFDRPERAYVFVGAGTSWALQARLLRDGTADVSYGFTIGVSGDTLAVGAPSKGGYKGAAYLYTRSGDTWTQRDLLKPRAGDTCCYFATGMALEGDVLALTLTPLSAGTGQVYVYEDESPRT